jgi:Ca-activated chloride channel family protein
MSFAAPLALLGLLGIPVLVVWYRGRERDRARAAAAFAAPHMAPSVTPVRPGWRRHAPLLAFALALAVLVVAAARPRTSVAVPVKRASIMLLTDTSGSMQARDVAPTRLGAARRAAARFIARVPRSVSVGIMGFDQTPRVLQSPTTDHAAARQALADLTVSGSTATGTAIDAAVRILIRPLGRGGKPPPAAIVLLSDGGSVRGLDPLVAAQEARRRHIPVYTVALGTPSGTIRVPTPGKRPGTVLRHVPPDPAALAAIARISRGNSYTAGDAARLRTVYERLGAQLGHRRTHREVTASFAGGALVLILLGSALSLRWFGRLI